MIGQVRPGIVRIEAGSGSGSGVIFDMRITTQKTGSGVGFVLTNYHVIEEAISFDLFDANVSVIVNDRKAYKASVVGVDMKRDLAVLEICCSKFTVLRFSDANMLTAGTEIVAMGYPLGLISQATSTRGIVSGMTYEYCCDRWVVQHDAPINPGNSGGPMVSLSGEVVGINTYKIAGLYVEGVGFAIAQKTIEEQLPRLKDGGDALDAVNVLDHWTHGPDPSTQRVDFRVYKMPWLLEWTLEEGGSHLLISGREAFDRESRTWLDVTKPSTGKMVVYQTGRYLVDFEGTGKYTVVVKTR